MEGTTLLLMLLGLVLAPFVINAICAYPIYKLLLRLKATQTVSKHLGESHQKKQGTPTMGGLMVLPGLLITFLVTGHWTALLTLLSFGAIGFLDDFVIPRIMPGKRGLGWIQKLGLQVGACLLVLIVMSMRVRMPGQPHTPIIEYSFMAFCILFFANAYNLADGLDALAGGLMLIIAPAGAIMGFLVGKGSFWPLLALTASVLPFLWFNKPPARVFMGDVGSLPLGAFLGYSIGSFNEHLLKQPYLLLPIFVLSFVLIVELVPVPLQILSVKLRGKRLFLRTPIHHAFEHMGWPESRILWLFLTVQFICAAVAVMLYWNLVQSNRYLGGLGG